MAGLLPPVRDIGVMRAPVRSCLFLAGIFVAILLCLALVGRLGIVPDRLSQAVIVAAFAFAALVGLAAHGVRPVDFYVADRGVPAALNGMAAAMALTGFAVVGIAGGVTESGLVRQIAGLLIGYGLAALFFAAGLRRFGGYSVPDFFAARFGGAAIRVLAAAIVFASSFLVLLAILAAAEPLVSGIFGLGSDLALTLTAAALILAVLPGGVRSLTWTEIVYFFLVAFGCLFPAALLSIQAAGETSPAIASAAELEALMAPFVDPFAGDPRGWASTLALFAIGSASLPLVLQRALTAESPRAAAGSMIWAMLFVVMLMAGALAFASSLGIWSAVGGTGAIAPAALVADLSPVIIGLVLAALLATIFACGQAALVAAAAAVSYDLWDCILDRHGPSGRRILVARLALIGVAAGAGRLAANFPLSPATLFAWALAIAAAAIFAPLLLALHWRRCNSIGALTGMGGGAALALLAFAFDSALLPGTAALRFVETGPAAAAFAGMALALLGAFAASVLTASSPGRSGGQPTRRWRVGRGQSAVQERPA